MKRSFSLPIIIIALYGASVGLNANFKEHLPAKKGEADIIQRIFGSLRIFVGDWAFIKAEEYHHRGLPFEKALDFHKGESLFAEREHEHAEEGRAVTSGRDLYSKLYAQVKVTEDSHLKSGEEKEALPWFYIEVAFNPHDIRGYVMGAYWLGRVGQHEESLKFLEEGNRNNPGSAQILTAIGETYMKENNLAEAMTYLERSCALWREAKDINRVSNNYEESDRFFAFDLLGVLYEKSGEYAKALAVYTEALKFKQNPAILDRITNLKTKVKAAQ